MVSSTVRDKKTILDHIYQKIRSKTERNTSLTSVVVIFPTYTNDSLLFFFVDFGSMTLNAVFETLIVLILDIDASVFLNDTS